MKIRDKVKYKAIIILLTLLLINMMFCLTSCSYSLEKSIESVLEISVYDNENNLINQGTGFCVKDSLQYALSASVQDEEKLSKFLKVVKTYTEIQELTPEILNSFIEKIYIGETERYDGKKMQEVEIIYKLVGAINLPQYGSD